MARVNCPKPQPKSTMLSSPPKASSRIEAGLRSTSFMSDSRRCSAAVVPWM
jgi:hypothetical protein